MTARFFRKPELSLVMDEGGITALAKPERQAWKALAAVRKELPRAGDAADVGIVMHAAEATVATLNTFASLRAGSTDVVGLERCQQTLIEVLGEPALPQVLRRQLAETVCDLVALRIAYREQEVGRQPVPTLTGRPEHAWEPVQIPTPILFQIRHQIFPPERMVVGMVRRGSGSYVLETAYDVTGVASLGHCMPDEGKLTTALLDMDASGTFFGFWAHSHPGTSSGATHPSQEDLGSYRRRIQAGDTQHLVAAVFAGKYVRFFGAPEAVSLVGDGLHALQGEEHVYEFST